jgi:hypothetical protein
MFKRKNIEVGKLYAYTTDSNTKIVCICIKTNFKEILFTGDNKPIEIYWDIFFNSNNNVTFKLLQNNSMLEEIK